MKKSNALMLSYMIFLVIALGAQIFFKWQGLDRIAMAATLAGCFFAFADLSSWWVSYQTYYADSLEKTLGYLFEINKVAINTAKHQKAEAIEIINRTKPYTHRDKKLEDIFDYANRMLEESKERMSEAEDSISKCNIISTEISKNKNHIKIFKTIELILMVLGFICFFIIVVFDYFIDLLIRYQTVATMIAFIVIVLNYYLRDAIEDNTKQELNQMIEAAEKSKAEYVKIDEVYEKNMLLENVTKLIETIKELDRKEEFDKQKIDKSSQN